MTPRNDHVLVIASVCLLVLLLAPVAIALVQRILAELSDADRADITAGATRAAAGGWPDGPVAAPPLPSPLAASERKLATVRERMLSEFESLGAGA